MQTILIPKQGSSTTAHLFVACFGAEVQGLRITVRDSKKRLVAEFRDIKLEVIDPGGHLDAEERVHFHGRVVVRKLRPGAKYTARAGVGSKGLASAEFRTLPGKLSSNAPFNVLLASCFHEGRDPKGTAARVMTSLPAKHRPHIKFLTGDQVYLDMPTKRFVVAKRPAELARLHLNTYRRTWGKGLTAVLRRGLAWCLADDHEFWNNFPQATQYLGNTMTAKGRARWYSISRDLFDVFQAPAGKRGGRPESFRVGRLRFLTLDTRYNRGAKRFLLADHFDAIDRWCAALEKRPQLGVLLVSQPLFDRCGAGMKGFDRNLPCFKDYDRLVKRLAACSRPMLFLSGDVHYGRVAAVLRPDGTAHRAEVLSSPTRHLQGKKSRALAPPPAFPPSPIAGVTSERVRLVKTDAGRNALFSGDQFATLGFTEHADSINVDVRHWSSHKASRLIARTSLRFAL